MLTQVVPGLDSIASPPLLKDSNQEEGGEGGEGTVTFKANQRLLGLYITGRPGSSGWLRVSVLTEGANDHPLVLDIPFKLSPCPFGFVRWRKSNFGSDAKVSAQKFFLSFALCPMIQTGQAHVLTHPILAVFPTAQNLETCGDSQTSFHSYRRKP